MARDGGLADRLRELEKLHASLRAMTATLDLGELVRTVLETIKSVTTPEALSLLLFDPERDELVFAASEMLCERTLVGRPVAAADGQPGADGHKLSVAIRGGDRSLGVLELRDRWDGLPFDDSDRARAEAVAAQLAVTLDPRTIAHDTEALQAVFSRIAVTVASHSTILMLHDEHGRELVFSSSRVLQPGVIDGVRLRSGQGIAGWVAQHRESVTIDDVAADPRHDPTLARRTGLIARTMVCVPLIHRGTLLGVIQVINKMGGVPFGPDEVRLVESLASQAAIAIANAQLYRQVELASLTDDLTGLGNTRRFNTFLASALERGGPLSLLVLDLDELKGIVDTFGHLVGSRAIATVGRLIAECVRPGDMAARFGGDEFVVVLPGTSRAAATEVAERIRCAVAACARPDGMDINISALTASVGVATFPEDATSSADLFRAADRAMYRVKFDGKNGVGVCGAGAVAHPS
jgi:diguanylate cyclase (GGDEF)-like protein